MRWILALQASLVVAIVVGIIMVAPFVVKVANGIVDRIDYAIGYEVR